MSVLHYLLLTLSIASLNALDKEYVTCVLPMTCVPLKECGPLMAALKESKRSSQTPAVVKYLKSQICGQHKNEPKVCCSEEVPHHKSIKKQLNELPPCKASFACVNLPDCVPLMYLLDLEKPISPRVIKLIESQQCGMGTLYPKVCCKELEEGQEISLFSPATEDGDPALPLEAKMEAMNWLFNEDLFDFTMFDYFLRRQKEN